MANDRMSRTTIPQITRITFGWWTILLLAVLTVESCILCVWGITSTREIAQLQLDLEEKEEALRAAQVAAALLEVHDAALRHPEPVRVKHYCDDLGRNTVWELQWEDAAWASFSLCMADLRACEESCQ